MTIFHRALFIFCLGVTQAVMAEPSFAQHFSFSGSNCAVYNVIPNSGSQEAVPVNTPVDVFFYSSDPSQCVTRFELWDDTSRRLLPTTVHYQTSWHPLALYQDRFYTFVRYQPVQPLAEKHHYTVRFNGEKQSQFVTGTDRAGDFIDMVPAIFKFPGCPLKASMAPEDIRLCGLRLIQYFFTMGTAVLNEQKDKLTQKMSLKDKQVIAAYANPATLFQALPMLTQYKQNPHTIHGVNLYRMRYFSRDPFGQSVIVSGLFVRPQQAVFDEKHVPIIELLHTHTAPQNSPSDGNMLETFFAMSLASHGFYVFAPDNLGHGVSQSSVEPLFFPVSMFDIHHDGLSALLEGLNLKDWDGQLSIFGGSQGAFDGMNLFRYLNIISYPYDIKNVYLSEGPMNLQRQFTDVMKYQLTDGHFQSPYVGYVQYDIPGLSEVSKLYIQQRESYNLLQQGMADRFFNRSNQFVKEEVRKFLDVDADYLSLQTEILGSTLLNNTDTYDAPNTRLRIYAYPKDTLVSAAAGEDMLHFLMKKDNHFFRLERGDCRQGSKVEQLVSVLMQVQPEITHVYCILIAADDFMRTMLLDNR